MTEQELLDLDLEALGAGRSPGLVPSDEVILCVCTHGRHDACCAEKGRPVAAALSEAYPEEAWEVSHIGGDRFAANLLVLPHGLYYGGVDAASAPRVAEATHDGRLALAFAGTDELWRLPLPAAEPERLRFEAHLGECDGCSGYLEDMRRLVVSLHELPEPPPDPATREALLRAFRELRDAS